MAKVSLQSGVNVIDLCLVRTFVNFVLSIFTMGYCKQHPVKDLPSECRFWLEIRSVAGLVGFTTLVIGVFYIPISIAAVIFGATPFWTALFGYILMKQPVQRFDLICMTACFFGVAFLALSKKEVDIETETSQESSSKDYAIGVACIVTTSILWSLANILTHLIK